VRVWVSSQRQVGTGPQLLAASVLRVVARVVVRDVVEARVVARVEARVVARVVVARVVEPWSAPAQ